MTKKEAMAIFQKESGNIPTIFIIFGITGDLAQRKLLPALLNLYSKKALPEKFAIVGFSRRAFSRDDFRQYIRDEMNVKPGQFKEEDVKHFIDHISYEQGIFDDFESYNNLLLKLKDIDTKFGQCSNKLFHLSVPPSLYNMILDNLFKSGLTRECDDQFGWTRVLVEKPFGSDIETAKKLDRKLAELFSESQIFRIDHYLAKEALQNIMVFRFANSLFEPLWNKEHIDKIHIKLIEKDTVGDRGAFYDNIGALKDVGQNHILQMLALIAMDEPFELNSDYIRKERAKVLRVLRPINAKNISAFGTRGQYEGYLGEKGVKSISATETYFRLEAYIDNSRWKDIPFFLESGKAMNESKAEIDIYFKNEGNLERQNILTFRIQPDEGIKIRFWVKTPGFGLEAEPKTLKFKYSDFPSLSDLPDAYERVLFDAIVGDQTLFTSTEEVMHAWKFISPIVESWHVIPLIKYKKGIQYL